MLKELESARLLLGRALGSHATRWSGQTRESVREAYDIISELEKRILDVDEEPPHDE
jgi:hypothetical protein